MPRKPPEPPDGYTVVESDVLDSEDIIVIDLPDLMPVDIIFRCKGREAVIRFEPVFDDEPVN